MASKANSTKEKGKAEAAPKLTKAQKQARLTELEKIMDSRRGGWKIYQAARADANGLSLGSPEQKAAADKQEKNRKAYTEYKRAYSEHVALRKELGIAVRASTRTGGAPAPAQKAAAKKSGGKGTGKGKAEQAPAPEATPEPTQEATS